VVELYGKRFTIEESFRDKKDRNLSMTLRQRVREFSEQRIRSLGVGWVG
jgi:hypothetical protein